MDRAETNSPENAACLGCTYNELIKSEKSSYCLNIGKIIDLNGLSYDDAINEIHFLIKSILNDIDDNMKPNCVKTFTIGKSFVRQRKHRKFDRLNPNTWRLDGLLSRWVSYQKNDYDGLFVLCVAPKEVIPANPIGLKQEEYAISLEQRLIQIFCFNENDQRLGNKSFETGSRVGNPIAGLVYVAFKLRDPEETEQVDLKEEVATGKIETKNDEDKKCLEENELEQKDEGLMSKGKGTDEE